MKRETSGHPRLGLPTFLLNYIYIYICVCVCVCVCMRVCVSEYSYIYQVNLSVEFLLYSGIMKRHKAFVYKDIYISLSSSYLERFENGFKWERQRQRRRTRIQTDLILTKFSAFSAPPQRAIAPPRRWHSEQLLLWLDCPSARPTDDGLTDCFKTDCCICGYLCIYNFIKPTHSFLLSTHRSSPLVYTVGTSCVAILYDGFVKGLYATLFSHKSTSTLWISNSSFLTELFDFSCSLMTFLPCSILW